MSEQAERIAAVREAAAAQGLDLVINARVDAFLSDRFAHAEERIEEAVPRADVYGRAGADCIYPIGPGDAETLTVLRSRIRLPLNALATPDAAPLGTMAAIGINRVSFGPFIFRSCLRKFADIADALSRSEDYECFGPPSVGPEWSSGEPTHVTRSTIVWTLTTHLPTRLLGIIASVMIVEQVTPRPMQIRQAEYIDWNSPGTLDPIRGEREKDHVPELIEVPDDLLTPGLREVAARTVHRPTEVALLPAERFSNASAEEWHRRIIDTPSGADKTREHSRAVQLRFATSCAGWETRPTAAEFYAAVRAERPTDRQIAILDTWATEAEWDELLEAWTEHAYTFYELAAALHRAGLTRCRAAAALNGWATYR